MLEMIPSPDDVIALRVSNKITGRDLDTIMDRLDEIMAKHEKVHVLVETHAIDGIEVDARGNLYVSGPGGLWVLSAAGEHLGTIVTPRHVHNMAWGDDGNTLYLCARDRLYRMRLNAGGRS